MTTTVPILPCPGGMVNVYDDNHAAFQPKPVQGGLAPPERMRTIVDMDLNSDGTLKARPALTVVDVVADPVGLQSIGGLSLVQDGANLRNRGTGDLVTTGLVGRVFLVEFGGCLFGSDGAQHFEIVGGAAVNWGLPVPTVTAIPVSGGSLPAGTYLVQASLSDARTNEGGVSGLVPVTLTTGQSIAVDVTGVNAEAVSVNLYAGRADQSRTTFVAQVDAQSGPFTIATIPQTADPPRTERMTGPWAGIQGAVAFRAFLLLWRDNVIVRSELAQPHLFDAESIMQFPDPVTAVEAVAGGLWVGTTGGVWWVEGDNPRTWLPVRKSSAAVVPGSAIMPGYALPSLQVHDLIALFVADGWLMAGLPDGSLAPLTHNRYRFPSCSRVSIDYVERNNLRQIAIGLIP